MFAVQWLRQSLVVGVVFVCVGLASEAAMCADLPTKAPASSGCIQAVDGSNGKIAGLAGSYTNRPVYRGEASYSLPLGCEFGLQIDSTAASFDSRFLASIGGHLFWRDPAKALLGVYGSYTYWDKIGGVRENHIGPEGEVYLGRWTLRGVAGVEFGNKASATVGPLIETSDVKTRFFNEMDAAYYLQDNFEMYVGHRYLGGKNALALGGEYGMPMSRGIMASLFVEGRVGEDDFHGVWGGVRFYFGQKDKTLIRRHREDDPIQWNSKFGVSSSPIATTTDTQTCTNGATNPPACDNI